jgi:hypothetical protein
VTFGDDQRKSIFRFFIFGKHYIWMGSCRDGEENPKFSSNFNKVQN